MEENVNEEAHFLKKKVKNVEVDAHCTETALVIRYEMEAAVFASGVSTVASHSKHYQKIIRLKDLNEGMDVSALARYVMQRCQMIPEYRMVELEQILYYLQKRQQLTASGDGSSLQNALDNVSMGRASISNVDEYIEMLYEETAEKTRGTALVLQLCRNAGNIQQLVENDTLIGALARVLRDDWKKSFELATNIVSIFCAFSSFTQFQSVVAHYKMGALCMQITEYELKRSTAWQSEARVADERSARKLNLAIRKQQQLIAACVNLLMNLADDVKVELKMVNRDIVLLLSKCITNKDSNVDLLIAAVQFLLKLSLFAENKEAMVNGRVVDSLSALFPIDTAAILRRNTIRLLFNLSFDVSLRNQMVSAGLVSHVAQLIEGDESALNLMYQLSINDDAKAMITFTDTIQTLMRRVLSGEGTDVVKALLVNISIEKRNAQLMCGSDGGGLDLIVESAFDHRDQLMIKLLRNIAAHTGPSQCMFTKWVPKLLERAMNEEEQLVRAGTTPCSDSFAVECLGTVNQLTALDWAQLTNDTSLVPWIQRTIGLHARGRGSNDLVLQVVILCGTMARQLEAARLLLPVVDQLVQLLAAQQEDDEMVVQVVYVFYGLITHEELSESVMGGSAHVGAYLIDLMHDRNAPIRSICDRALSLIAERSEEWARKMDVERFRWHNAQWLEMVAESGTLASADSAISDSPDLFNDVFGAEDILDDSAALSHSLITSIDRDF